MKLPKELTTITKTSKALAFIVFITLPFLGFFLGTNYQASLDSASQTSTTKPILTKRATTPTPSPINETSNWKTYTSERFVFKYPDNLYAADYPQKQIIFLFEKQEDIKPFLDCLKTGKYFYDCLDKNVIYISMIKADVDSYFPIKDYKYSSAGVPEQYTDTQGRVWYIDNQRENITKNNKSISADTLIGNKYYKIYLNILEKRMSKYFNVPMETNEFWDKSNLLTKQILSTFKFTQ